MNRADFQKLSNLRVREARTLLSNRCFEGAYYLLGYAVECALKACVAKQIKRYEFPDRKLVNRSYTHDLEELLDVSGLKVQHKQEVQDNPAFAVNWATVKDWSEEARYTTLVTEEKARDFFAAVTARRYGVLRWLKKLW